MKYNIKQIEKQCYVPVRCGLNGIDTKHELDLEKFAELIVRECAKFMDENSGYNDSNGCWFPEPEDMLKHFGIEE